MDAAKSFKDAGYLSQSDGKKAKKTVSLLSFQKNHNNEISKQSEIFDV